MILDGELLKHEGKLNLELAFCCKKMREVNEGMYKQYSCYWDPKHVKIRKVFLRKALTKFESMAEEGECMGEIDGCCADEA